MLNNETISVKWTPPADTSGISWYTATATQTVGGAAQHCEVAKEVVTCNIQSLDAYTDDSVTLVACDKKISEGSRICSNVVTWKDTVKTFQSGKFIDIVRRKSAVLISSLMEFSNSVSFVLKVLCECKSHVGHKSKGTCASAILFKSSVNF